MTLKSILWMLLIAGVLDAQSTENRNQALTGAFNGNIPKTSFSCRERPVGYYADIETDCQVYHMCDEQGRQFDYSCPNATLFQQRMLICDHWYMVDCSSSVANYEFNKLIGQRNQPFVSESDAEKRTPRPDILDRPYAADYKGESYRKHIGKNKFLAPQNTIIAPSKNADRKYELLETQASSHFLPSQISQNELDPTSLPASEEFPQNDINVRPRQAPPTGFEPPKLLPTYNQQFRANEESRLKQLGLSAQASAQASVFQSTKRPVAKTFDPDKNFKAFEHIFQPGKKATHKDYDFSRYFTKKDGLPTAVPVRRLTSSRRPMALSTTTRRVTFNQPTTTTQRPMTTTRQIVTTKITTTTRTPTTRAPTTTTRPTTTRSTVAQRLPAFNQNNFAAQKSTPAIDLLPPHEVSRLNDDGSTKGPPIYYEWKVPDRGLLPPKLDNETDIQSKHNTRSIAEEGNFGTTDFQSSESRRLGNGNSIKIQYKDLQKLFSIPEFEFPIEQSGRDGYEKPEAVNSFQVKIPYKSGSDRYYYLEHAHCNPACHPYFFKPGRCEPCVKL